jgi:hypothetical protein
VVAAPLLSKSTQHRWAASDWYIGLLAKVRLGEPIHTRTFAEVAEKFLTYQDEVAHVSVGQRGNYHDKWKLLKPLPGSVRVNDIDLRFLEDLRERRYQHAMADAKEIALETPKKDLLFIRLVLKHAIDRERCLDRLPAFPSFGQQKWKIVPRPRPFFTQDQYKTLKKTAAKRVRTAENPRLREQRQELHDFEVEQV